MRWFTYIFPKLVLKTSSKYNTDIRVLMEPGEYKLLVNGARESGTYIDALWGKALDTFGIDHMPTPDRVLVLGVAGGSVIRILHTKFPRARIMGVDVDRVMIDIGIRYFGLGKIAELRIACEDAKVFIQKERAKYDCIVVDLFIGPSIPDFVIDTIFHTAIQKRLRRHGFLLINYVWQLGYERKAMVL